MKRVWDTLATGLKDFIGMANQLYPPGQLQQWMVGEGEDFETGSNLSRTK